MHVRVLRLFSVFQAAEFGGGAALFAAGRSVFLQCSGVGLPYFVPGAQRLTSFVLWVKPFVRANVEWSDTGVFEQRCMCLELVTSLFL